MSRHELKAWREPFGSTWRGFKRCEIRREGDRSFAAGDELLLREYDGEALEGARYTGREILARVMHLERGPDWGLAEGLVVMSLALIAKREAIRWVVMPEGEVPVAVGTVVLP